MLTRTSHLFKKWDRLRRAVGSSRGGSQHLEDDLPALAVYVSFILPKGTGNYLFQLCGFGLFF